MHTFSSRVTVSNGVHVFFKCVQYVRIGVVLGGHVIGMVGVVAVVTKVMKNFVQAMNCCGC